MSFGYGYDHNDAWQDDVVFVQQLNICWAA